MAKENLAGDQNAPDEDNLSVSDGMVVGIDYSLSLDDDPEVIDSSAGHEPLEFIQGRGQVVSGLEQELYGMQIGDEKNVVVAPAEGYGETDPEAYQMLPLDAFPSDMTVEPGMGLQLSDVSGRVFEAYVTEVRPDGVVLDFNHPLAGRTLHFNVRIASLRAATSDEMQHGHVHGADHEEDEEG